MRSAPLVRYAIFNWQGTQALHDTWATPGSRPELAGNGTAPAVEGHLPTMHVGDLDEFVDHVQPADPRLGTTMVVVIEVVSRG